jgi:hypothetical protein
MFKVFESIPPILKRRGTWKKHGEFKTFDEAHAFAQETICKDVFHEGSKERIYWFSDENGDGPYRVAIDTTGYMDSHN